MTVAAGVEFDELQGGDQAAALANMAVFARVEPSHKQRLVEQLKAQVNERNLDVAGVNLLLCDPASTIKRLQIFFCRTSFGLWKRLTC